MARPRIQRLSSVDRGFSLAELGIVVAAIAILATVVIMGRGYLDAARQNSARELVHTLRTAAQMWSQRNRNGLDFGNASVPLNVQALKTAGLLPNTLTTPWGTTGVGVVAEGAATGCTGNTCVRVCVQAPDQANCNALRDSVDKAIRSAAQPQCGTGGGANNCGITGGGWILSVVTR